MTLARPLISVCLALLAAAAVPSARAANTADDLFDPADLKVRITEDLPSVQVRHEGRPVLLMRLQDPGHTIDAPYDKTARPCPPFCIQPAQMPSGVETIAELELIAYLRRAAAGDEGVLVIDSRTPEWTAQGTIPGSRNIPYTRLDPGPCQPGGDHRNCWSSNSAPVGATGSGASAGPRPWSCSATAPGAGSRPPTSRPCWTWAIQRASSSGIAAGSRTGRLRV